MRRIWLSVLFLLARIVCFGSESGFRDCHVQVTMSNGPVPQSLTLEVFADNNALFRAKVPWNGSIVLPPLAPGEYRLQTGEGTNFVTSGPLHVPDSGSCEMRINILGQANAAHHIVEDDIDVEDLRVPRKARTTFEKGFSAMQHGQLEEARKDFLEVIRLDPKLSRAYNALGVISGQQKDRTGAREYFEKALELNPRSKSALMNLAKLSMLEKQYNSAIAFLERFRQATPDTADVHAMEADAYLKLANYPEAIHQAQAAHSLPHGNWDTVHLIAATAYEALQQPQMAAVEYKLYLDESSNSEMRAVASRRIKELGNLAQVSSPSVAINSLLSR